MLWWRIEFGNEGDFRHAFQLTVLLASYGIRLLYCGLMAVTVRTLCLRDICTLKRCPIQLNYAAPGVLGEA